MEGACHVFDRSLHLFNSVFPARRTILIKDVHGRIIVILAGRPNDPSWDTCIQDAVLAMKTLAEKIVEPTEFFRRGAFPSIAAGISYGGGQTEPCNLGTTELVRSLLEHPSFIRMANFANSVFARYAPKLYQYYCSTLDLLFNQMPHLRRPFPGSIFTAASFNFGPQTVTYCHVDQANVPFGLCAIAALGDFDPEKGGHVYLWELGLVIEFPSGSIIKLPSGSVHHGNTPIRPHEFRCSFTTYCAGGLFRWVAYGFRTAAAFARRDPVGKRRFNASLSTRWRECLNLFSKASELTNNVRAVFGL
ncbi:hypothetical protein BV25DRAFT_1811048 [Artomyces pyxidatus]|uniref:Uncharacterized protein n=1 Tax=Artomyces pyxidatus TaxID=48021 RepID=A0ACB8SQ12_9AGAM|nr:hypothetical protein BV25DRAFT_1811048 [Artomyces pyxidatus]